MQISSLSSRFIIPIGFAVILVMMLAIMGMWIVDVERNTARIRQIVSQQAESNFVATMRDVALNRAISLHRMSDMDDPFMRDEEYMHFRGIAEKFLIARDKFIELMDKNGQKANIWEETKSLMNNGGQIQNRAVNMILEERMQDAKDTLVSELSDNQKTVMNKLNEIFFLQQLQIEQELQQTVHDNQNTYRLIALLASATVLFSIFMVYLMKRTVRTEQEFREQSSRVRALYDVSSAPGTTPSEQVEQMLKLGCQFLSMEIGKVSKLDVQDQSNTFAFVYARPGLDVKVGTVMPLEKTFCQYTIRQDEPFEIYDINKSPIREKMSHLGAYIATKITVNGQPFGTVNFSSNPPRKKPFSDGERDLVKLIGSWISMTLERMVREKELEAAKEMSEAANRTKSSFLANMSHELRTPLNAIIGYSEMLYEMNQDELEEEYLLDLDKITQSGRHLLTLINDILDISKIEAGKFDLSMADVELSGLIDEISGTVTPLVKKNHNRFVVKNEAELTKVYTDATRLKQILFNLLSNAGKFCTDGEITFRTFVDRSHDTPRLTFVIEDTGIGIDNDKIDQLFRPFSQLNNAVSGEYGGTGLGLVISQRLAHLMDGEIKVHSEAGRGTTFTLWIPASCQRQMERTQFLRRAHAS